MYKLFIKPIFFLFDPENIHHKVFKLLRFTLAIPGMKALFKAMYVVKDPRLERELFGIKFPNPVGLGAGFDKDAKLYNELEYVGFGFVEIGTVTPVGQAGNPKPRLFRVPNDGGLINRMGFNNDGVEAAVERLKKRKTTIVIGGNIGKNKLTPNEQAVDDYEACFEAMHPYVDYFVVNVSSPNTPGLRALQDPKELKIILDRVKALNATKDTQKPILLKIAPDLENADLDDIVNLMLETKIDGLIATNTTIDKSGLKTEQSKLDSIHNSGDLETPGDMKNGGRGGLSGKPLAARSTEVIRYLSEKSNKAFPIIGVGGIHSAEDALEKLDAGADLVQIYTGFVYEGPGLVKKICKALLKR
jgi:dihydroorotate dehydrogenase